MKNLPQTCAAYVLALVLTHSAFAGEISTGITQPPPPSQPATQEDARNGDIHTPVYDENAGAGSTLEAALGLMRAILSVL
jgi:hypothetical protein